MFKTLIILSLLICTIFSQNYSYQKYYYPRTDHSCDANGMSLSYGWYWDGQKCEKCYNDACSCSQYFTCYDCQSGFGMVYPPDLSSGFCAPCPQAMLNQSFSGCGGTKQMDNRDISTAQCTSTSFVPFTDGIQECNTCDPFRYLGQKPYWNGTVIGLSTRQARQDYLDPIYNLGLTNMTTNTLRNTLGFALGLRAYSCRPDVKDIYNTSNGVYDPAFGWVDKLVVYQKYGGFCYYIKGCQQYYIDPASNYPTGKCGSCFDGFYLNEFQTCTPCMRSCVYAANFSEAPYINNCPLSDSTYTTIATCERCLGPNSCNDCQDGWYLVSNQDYKSKSTSNITIDNTSYIKGDLYLLYSSYCRQCSPGCFCTKDIAIVGDADTANIAPVSDEYFMITNNGSNTCYRCNDPLSNLTNYKYCQECDRQNADKRLFCKNCLPYYDDPAKPVPNRQFIIYVSNLQMCVACPDYCAVCVSINGTNQTTCVIGGCFNGYFDMEDNTTKIRSCYSCSQVTQNISSLNININPLYARCVFNSLNPLNQSLLVTQCQSTNNYQTQYIEQGVVGLHNRQLGNMAIDVWKNDYFLVYNTSANYTPTCVQNQFFCQQMKDERSNCAKCYPGYLLTYYTDTQTIQCITCSAEAYSNTTYGSVHDQETRTNCLNCSLRQANDSTNQTGSTSHGSVTFYCNACTFQSRDTISVLAYTWNNVVNNNFNNYALFIDTQQNEKYCVKCNSGCETCQIFFDNSQHQLVNNCTQCFYGYTVMTPYQGSPQVCVKCENSYCKSCDTDPKKCSSCFPGYRLWQKSVFNATTNSTDFVYTCEACEWGCLDCQASRKICNLCNTYNFNVYLSGQVCQPQKRNCVYMNGAQCQVCEYGYRLVDGKCLQCMSPEGGFIHCHTCIGSTTFYDNIGKIGKSTSAYSRTLEEDAESDDDN